MDVETHQAVFQWMLAVLAEKKLLTVVHRRGVYLDGSLNNTSTGGLQSGSPTALYFSTYDGTDLQYAGLLDEARISSVALSSSWIATEYNNESAPATYLSLGTQQAYSGSGGWSNGYTYQRTITINYSQVPNTNQTNFPVLISGTYSYLATTGNGGNVTNANGYDIIFTSDAAGATILPFQRE